MVDSPASRTLPGCPLLGLPDGTPGARQAPWPDHRCFAGPQPVPIDRAHQLRFCLSDHYADCDRYPAEASPQLGAVQLGAVQPGATATAAAPSAGTTEPAGAHVSREPASEGSPQPGEAGDPDAPEDGVPEHASPEERTAAGEAYWLASAELGRPTVNDEPAPASSEPTAPHVPGTDQPAAAPPPEHGAVPAAAPALGLGLGQAATTAAPGGSPRLGGSTVSRLAVVLVLLLVAAVAGYGLAFLSAELVGGTSSSAAGMAGSVARSPLPTPDLIGSAAPTGSATPSVSATPNPTPAAGPSATPPASAAASPLIHVVAPGENLTSIAARYGVSVQAIAAANGISDPNTIYTGQRLVIPAR